MVLEKQHDVYSSVLDVYPDLIDANGEFNKELAETVVNTREMSEEDKAALQNMIDIAGQAEEAFEALNDYMTDIFGDLGNTMSDALVDSFKTARMRRNHSVSPFPACWKHWPNRWFIPSPSLPCWKKRRTK